MPNSSKNPITKLTQKQEAFVQAYIELGDSHLAYGEAYNSSSTKKAMFRSAVSKLLKHEANTLLLGGITEGERQSFIYQRLLGAERDN